MTIAEGLTALLAAIVAWISYRQYHTENNNLRLSLFDRRLVTYQRVADFIHAGVREADYTIDEIMAFGAVTSDAQFLFGKEIPHYIKILREKAIRLRQLNDRLHEQQLPIGAERNAAAEENNTIVQWLLQQTTDAQKLFDSYLTFGHIK